jgi:hypothetical protein
MTRPVALVTGASAGIGEQFARILAARGHDLVLVARDRARLEALAKDLEAAHGNTNEVLAADLADPRQLAAVEARAETVDLLINNAGFGTFGNFHELDADTEEREIRVNVVAVSRLTHAAARGMVARGRGGILNVSSIAGFQPTPNDATYAATKAFVLSFTEAVHEELKPTGVRVSCLAPGFTRTEFQQRAGIDGSKLPAFAWQDAATVARAGLDGLEKNRAVVVPGALNRVAATLSGLTPHGVTRRVAKIVVGRSH